MAITPPRSYIDLAAAEERRIQEYERRAKQESDRRRMFAGEYDPIMPGLTDEDAARVQQQAAQATYEIPAMMATSVAADVPAGWAGLLAPEGERANAIQAAQEKFTFMPRGEASMRVLESLGNAMNEVGEFLLPIREGYENVMNPLVGPAVAGIPWVAAGAAAETVPGPGKGAKVASTAERASGRFVRAAETEVEKLTEMLELAGQRDPNISRAAQDVQAGQPIREARPDLVDRRTEFQREGMPSDAEIQAQMDTPVGSRWNESIPENDVPMGQQGRYRGQRGSVEDTGGGRRVLSAQAQRGAVTSLDDDFVQELIQFHTAEGTTVDELKKQFPEYAEQIDRLGPQQTTFSTGSDWYTMDPKEGGGFEVYLGQPSQARVRVGSIESADEIHDLLRRTEDGPGGRPPGRGEPPGGGEPSGGAPDVDDDYVAELIQFHTAEGSTLGELKKTFPEYAEAIDRVGYQPVEFSAGDGWYSMQPREGRGGFDGGYRIYKEGEYIGEIDSADGINDFLNQRRKNALPSDPKQRGSVQDTGGGQRVLAAQAQRGAVTNTAELGQEYNALNAGLNRARGTRSLNRADYIYGDTPAAKPNSRRIVDVGIELQEEALNAWGGKPMDMTPENAKVVADNMTEEAAASFQRRPEMSGWYKANLDEAMQHASKLHPELATDPTSQSAFKFIMAITSNGQEVPLNAKLTNQYYAQWKRDGKFPIAGSGKERAAMEKSFETANRLVDDMGYEGFDKFLDSDFTVRELQEAGFKISGENLDTTVKGSVIFGPKIGGGFMQNLRGNYDPPTFDRWWQRTYGRHTGTLISDPQKIGDQIEAFTDALDDVEPEAFRSMGMTKKQALENPEEAARVIYNNFSKGGFKVKTEVNNAARNLAKSLDNVVDSPAGGNQREFMRDVILQVRDNLRARGIDVDTADVQALLWYSEKDLYGKMGAFTNTDTVDYATVWKQLAEQGQEGANALNRGAP